MGFLIEVFVVYDVVVYIGGMFVYVFSSGVNYDIGFLFKWMIVDWCWKCIINN